VARKNQDLQIVQLAGGRYRIRGRHGRGRNAPQWQQTFDTLDEAEDFRSDYYRRHISGQTSSRLAEGRHSFADYISSVYWPRHAKLRLEEQTRDNYRGLLVRHLEPYFGTKPLNQFTRGEIEDYLARSLQTCHERNLRNPCAACRQDQLGERVTITLANGETRRPISRCEIAITINTANALLVLLQSIFGYAARNGHLLGDGPAAKIKPIPDPSSTDKPIEIIDPRDVAWIARHCSCQDDVDILEFHAYIGLRPGEIFARHFRDAFNQDGSLKRKLDVYSALYYTGSDKIHEKKTKNHRYRRVLIPEPIGDTLKRRFLAAGRNLDALIFAWDNGGYYDPRTWRTHRYIPAMRAAGFGPETDKYKVPYALRATCASLMAHDPALFTLKEIANQLGHSQQTCERYYLELFDEAEHLRGKDMATVIREARAAVENIPVTPAATRKQVHRVRFGEVLRLAADGLNTTQIAQTLGHPVGTIRTSIRLHNYRWQRTDNRWTLEPQTPNGDRHTLAEQVATLALEGSTNIEIADELGCSVHRIPRLLALAGYRRTRGMQSRVVSTRRAEDGESPPLSPTPLSARRLAALFAPDSETCATSASA